MSPVPIPSRVQNRIASFRHGSPIFPRRCVYSWQWAGCGTRRTREPNDHYLYYMSIKRKIPSESGHFFITFTCYNWLPLIEITHSYYLVYNWFDILKKDGHNITGYVIMPTMCMSPLHLKEQKRISTKLLVTARGLWVMKL